MPVSGPDRDSAKKIMWKDVLKPISRQLMLNARFNETELTATLTNDSVIYLLGVDSAEEEKKKLLGQKYKLVVIDEAASFSVDLNELVYGVLKPSVADYRGTICLIGTPGNVKRGLFFDLTQGQDPSAAGTWSGRDSVATAGLRSTTRSCARSGLRRSRS